jgi:hypothetical protein
VFKPVGHVVISFPTQHDMLGALGHSLIAPAMLAPCAAARQHRIGQQRPAV